MKKKIFGMRIGRTSPTFEGAGESMPHAVYLTLLLILNTGYPFFPFSLSAIEQVLIYISLEIYNERKMFAGSAETFVGFGKLHVLVGT